jgi:hypothetical protein
MAINNLSKADIKAIMELNEMTAYYAWNHGHKAGDEGAPRGVNPFQTGGEASAKLLELMSKALSK